jgi:carnitine 3-dehydrogenase
VKRSDVDQMGLSMQDISGPITLLQRSVPADWTDYNGHMNEAKYLEAFAQATDLFMELIGCDAAYISDGGSYFTVETHIRYLAETHAGSEIYIETQCLGAEGRRLHLFHQMYYKDTLLATGEHMLIHVSLQTRRASAPGQPVAARVAQVAAAHAALRRPVGAGKAIE